MTVRVDTDANNIIVFAAPIVRVFIGQPLINLHNWMSKQPNFRRVKLK
jgi:hypothetical protein